VVHRDIKPPNILVLLSGTAKLTDFGVARIDSTLATQVGAVLGTPAYMSPEQLLGRPVTAASDLYSVGVVLLELVSGIRPQPGGARLILEELRRGEPVEVPPAFVEILARALAESPAARFASAREMAAAIQRSLDDRTSVDLISGLTPCKADDPTTLGELPPARKDDSEFSWAPEVLATVERELTEHIGPMARLLVAKYARQARDLSHLSEALAAHIRDPAERRRFLARFRPADIDTGANSGSLPAEATAGSSSGSLTSARPAGGLVLDPIRLQALGQLFADYVGPMAKMLIRGQLRQAKDLDDLHARLARMIADDAQRRAFLSSLPRD